MKKVYVLEKNLTQMANGIVVIDIYISCCPIKNGIVC